MTPFLRLEFCSFALVALALGLALAAGGERETATKERGMESGPGLYDVDPKVMEDPFYQTYPDAKSKAVMNARVMAKKVNSVFDINGFQVNAKNGGRVGILPSYYMGFPKSGSTATYRFLTRFLPCMLSNDEDVEKELGFVFGLKFQCSIEDDIIESCDSRSVERVFTEATSQFNEGVDHILRNPRCQDAFVFDGTPKTMYGAFQKIENDDGENQMVPFDAATFIHTLTPNARFIALARENDLRSLHSHYFFFKPDARPKDYRLALARANEILDEVGNMESTCQGLLWDYPGRSRDFPRMQSYGASCNVQRFRILFGENNVFITDVQSILACSDNILDWFSETVKVKECSPALDKNKKTESQGDFRVKGLDLTSRMTTLEERLIDAFETVGFPLIPKEKRKEEKEGT